MCGKAAKIQLTEKQYDVLQQIRHSTTAAQRLVQRAGVILMAFRGMLNVRISQEVGLSDALSDGRTGTQTSRPLEAALAAVL